MDEVAGVADCAIMLCCCQWHGVAQWGFNIFSAVSSLCCRHRVNVWKITYLDWRLWEIVWLSVGLIIFMYFTWFDMFSYYRDLPILIMICIPFTTSSKNCFPIQESMLSLMELSNLSWDKWSCCYVPECNRTWYIIWTSHRWHPCHKRIYIPLEWFSRTSVTIPGIVRPDPLTKSWRGLQSGTNKKYPSWKSRISARSPPPIICTLI